MSDSIDCHSHCTENENWSEAQDYLDCMDQGGVWRNNTTCHEWIAMSEEEQCNWGDDQDLSLPTNGYTSEDILGCTDSEACNYDEIATADDGSCEYEVDCAGTCGGDLEFDCCGVCGGDNSQCSNCCGIPFNDDCTSDCYEDPNTGECCPIWDVDACGVCNGNGDCYTNGTCCHSTMECWYSSPGVVDYDPAREGCMDICVKENNGQMCNFLAAPINGLGALCNSGLSSHMPWHSGGETCALYTEEACCVNGYRQDATTGWEWEESLEHSCNDESSNLYPIDCNTEDCEEVYDEGHTTGLEEGILIGAQSGDVNGDDVLNVLDMVIYIEMIINP